MPISVSLKYSQLVIAGLVPAIPNRLARPCPHKRDGRDGHPARMRAGTPTRPAMTSR